MTSSIHFHPYKFDKRTIGLSHSSRPPQEIARTYDYVACIKQLTADRPYLYVQFIDVLRAYKHRKCDINDVIYSVAGLFQDFPELLEGFGSFLPPRSMMRDVTEFEPSVYGTEEDHLSLWAGSPLELRRPREHLGDEEALKRGLDAMQLADAECSRANSSWSRMDSCEADNKGILCPRFLDVVETCLPGLQTRFTDIFRAYCSYLMNKTQIMHAVAALFRANPGLDFPLSLFVASCMG